MSDVHEPSHEHAQFDALCADAEDWGMLPSVDAPTPQWLQASRGAPREEGSETNLDNQILAGLVSPW